MTSWIVRAPDGTLGTFQRALRRGGLPAERVPPDGLQVCVDEDCAWIYVYTNGRAEYEEGGLDAVALDRMAFFDAPYESIALLRRVLLAMADDPRIWVDLDNGTILPGKELLARLRQEPDWLMGLPTVTGD